MAGIYESGSLAYLLCAITQPLERRIGMCIYCLEDELPFYLRTSSAFPRKLAAEAVEVDAVAGKPELPGAFSCDAPEPAVPSVWPKRKSARS